VVPGPPHSAPPLARLLSYPSWLSAIYELPTRGLLGNRASCVADSRKLRRPEGIREGRSLLVSSAFFQRSVCVHKAFYAILLPHRFPLLSLSFGLRWEDRRPLCGSGENAERIYARQARAYRAGTTRVAQGRFISLNRGYGQESGLWAKERARGSRKPG
jgi:hypothetical protein